MPTDNSSEITAFLINELDSYPSSVAVRAAKKFNISRQAVLKRLNALIEQGDIEAKGRTRGRKYSLKENLVLETIVELDGLEEDIVYRKLVRPALGEMPDNVQRICNYGFTESLNNAIDHSVGEKAAILVSRTPSVIDITIQDDGIGIFKKIKDAFRLDEERHSLIHLAKGKLTTDEKHHSGQGIYFTSRVFDYFAILSGYLFFWHRRNYDDWLTEDKTTHRQGTYVRMRICTHSQTKIRDVFDKFSTPNEQGFSRTHVPVSLAQYEDDGLVSRSQAKRILTRFEQFEEVLLDFKGVDSIGQAFADEIFRVFRRSNRSTRIHWINDNEQVAAMIQRATDRLIEDVERGR